VPEKNHLKNFITLAGPDLLCVSNDPQSQEILKRIEREASFQYQTLTLEESFAASVSFV
jgi:dimethylargininase